MVKYYDINRISGLICLFKQTVSKYGKSSKTVKTYKEQIEYLMKNDKYIKQSDIQKDLDFVYRLLGMQNTDAIKWDATLDRLDMFISAMNYIEAYKTKKDKVKCLRYLLKNQKINRAVYDYVTEVHNLKAAERNLRFEDMPVDDIEDNKVNTFGVLTKDMSSVDDKKGVYGRDLFEHCVYGQLKYRDLVNSKQMQSLDDFTNEFLADKDQQAKLSKLNKRFVKPEDVYANIHACEMLMQWFGANNFPFMDNERIVNKSTGDEALKQLFRIKDNKYQVYVAAGLCKYLGQLDIDDFNYCQDARHKKFLIHTNSVSYLVGVLNQILDTEEAKKTIKFVNNGLMNEAKIAVPKDATCKQYYEPKTFEEMQSDLECYKQFKNCLKTRELANKLMIQGISDFVLKTCGLQSDAEYQKMLTDKYRFRASYIIRVFDILYRH